MNIWCAIWLYMCNFVTALHSDFLANFSFALLPQPHSGLFGKSLSSNMSSKAYLLRNAWQLTKPGPHYVVSWSDITDYNRTTLFFSIPADCIKWLQPLYHITTYNSLSTRAMSTHSELEEKTLSEIKAKHDPSSLHKDMEVASVSEVNRKRVLRKMDIHLLPFVSFLYLLSFLWVSSN